MSIRFGNQKLIERKNEELSRLNLELKEANEKLFVLSHVDGLTGIANRSAFDEAIRSEWDRCMRLSLPLTLFMVDIDFFKGYNDHYGHQAGDECLRRIADVIVFLCKAKVRHRGALRRRRICAHSAVPDKSGSRSLLRGVSFAALKK